MARVESAWAILFGVSPLLAELYDRVREIPSGCCASYSSVGRSLSQPVSGFLVGRWMASAPADVPWQRVVAKDGSLLTGKRDAHLAVEQSRRLKLEGVPFLEDGRVDMAQCIYEP